MGIKELCDIIYERGLSYEETKKLIKDNYNIDLRTKTGKQFLEEIATCVRQME